MTVKDVATEVLAESLLAVQDLRRKYTGEPQVTVYACTADPDAHAVNTCPLCKFQKSMQEDSKHLLCMVADKHFCPWYFIEGHSCEDFPDVEDEDTVDYDTFSIPDRLARIDRWEEAIKAELAAREAKP
jgi:hypothetical protein